MAKTAPAKEEPKGKVETESGNDLTKTKPTFTRKKAVIVDNFSIPDDGTSVYIKIMEPFTTKPNIDIKTGLVKQEDGKDLEITIGRVIDLEDDSDPVEVRDLVVGIILKNRLEELYPDQGYVGKSFEIQKVKVEKKRAKAYKVWEV